MALFKNTFEYGKDWEQQSSGEQSKAKGFAAKQHEHLSQGVSHANSSVTKKQVFQIIRVVFGLILLGTAFSGAIQSYIKSAVSVQDSTDFQERIERQIQDTVNENLKASGLNP